MPPRPRPTEELRGHRRRPPGPPPKRFWHCPDCSATTAIQVKDRHVCPARPDTRENLESGGGMENLSLDDHDESPLNRFFLSYPSFPYQRSLPPAESFHQLQRHQKWRRESAESQEAWDRYQTALKEEFKLWFGAEDDLGAWHALCRAIGIEPLPASCKECEKAVRNRHVNLVDLIEWGRNGGKESGAAKKVRVFRSVGELAEYSRTTHKIFRNDLDENAKEVNVVLRHLLRRLFNKKPRGIGPGKVLGELE